MNNKKNIKPENQQLLPGIEDGTFEAIRVGDQAGFDVRSLNGNKPRENRVSVRISAQDLEEIKRLALVDGTPYHSLLSRIIHDYVNAANSNKGEFSVRIEDEMKNEVNIELSSKMSEALAN